MDSDLEKAQEDLNEINKHTGNDKTLAEEFEEIDKIMEETAEDMGIDPNAI